jgi:hypothetical protein
MARNKAGILATNATISVVGEDGLGRYAPSPGAALGRFEADTLETVTDQPREIIPEPIHQPMPSPNVAGTAEAPDTSLLLCLVLVNILTDGSQS